MAEMLQKNFVGTASLLSLLSMTDVSFFSSGCLGFQMSRCQLENVANTPLCVHSQGNSPLHPYKISQSTQTSTGSFRNEWKEIVPQTSVTSVTGAARNTAMMRHVTY